MYVEQAFDDAQIHGYTVVNKINRCVPDNGGIEVVWDYANTLLDPKFWVALGKAHGWNDKVPSFSHEKKMKVYFITFDDNSWYTWQVRYLSHIQVGESAQDFFKQLYPPKETETV